MRLSRVELLHHVRPPWTKDFVAELIPPDGYTLYYDGHADVVVIIKYDVPRAVLHGSMVRYADVYESPAAIPEPEPTTPSVAQPEPAKRRGRPPRKPVE